MGFLNWLTGKNISKERNGSPTSSNLGLTTIGNTEPICPYCNYKFDKMPLKKKQCPNCNNFVRSRTRPLDNKKVLVKEDQIDELERQWAIKNERSDGIVLGASPKVRKEMSQKLAMQIERNSHKYADVSLESSKQIRKIIAECVRKNMNVGQTSREIVRQVEGVSIERAITMINTETMKAVNSQLYKKNAKEGITKLERLAVLDERTCDKCAALDGKIFTIEEAKVIDSEAHEGCRCTWVPAIDIPK